VLILVSALGAKLNALKDSKPLLFFLHSYKQKKSQKKTQKKKELSSFALTSSVMI
jgi:hypothetical protein